MDDIKFNSNNIPTGSFLNEVMNKIPATKENEGIRNSIYQTYITMFPAKSIVNNISRRSENIPGMSTDMVRVYGDTMVKWGRKLADTIHMPEIEAALTYFGSEAALRASDPNIVAVAQNITQRADFLRNPRYNKWVSRATTMSYTAFILGNVSSAVVNVSTLPLFAYPILGGRFGYPTASTEMAKAMKVANKAFAIKSLGGSTDWGTGTEYERLYNTLQAHGQLEHTMAREILEGSRQRSEDFTGSKAKVMDALSYTFSATERYNRAVTGISAYNLAKNSGMSETKAIDFALDTVKEAT